MVLKKVKETVRQIMEQSPETRDDDFLLMKRVCSVCGYDPRGVSLDDYLSHGTELPGFESVQRARRKVQLERPDLRGSADAERVRKEREQQYRAFAKVV